MSMQSKESVTKTASILTEQEYRLSALYEMRFLQLRELARYVCREYLPVSDAMLPQTLHAIRSEVDAFFSSVHFHEEALPEHRLLLARQLSELHGLDRAVFARFVAEYLGISGGGAACLSLLTDTTAWEEGIVAYVKNKWTDQAYDVFSSCFLDPKLVYAKNFQHLCESVRAGQVTYGILPAESADGRMMHVDRMMDAYGLKICARTDITDHHSGEETAFVLVSSALRCLEDPEDRCFSFEMYASDISPSDGLYDAVSVFGLSLHRVESTRRSGGGFTYHVTIRENHGDLGAFLTFLLLFFPDFRIHGIYTEL